MPIHIQELIIRATIERDNAAAGGSMMSDSDRRRLVEDCVDQVLDIIRENKER
jgi:hypothetical protein